MSLGDMGQKPRRALQRLKLAFDRIDCEWFLSDGTLLGFVREGDFIAHDTDIDVGVWIHNYSGAIRRTMLSHGFDHTRTIGGFETGHELTFHFDGVNIDVFFYYHTDDGHCWHAVWSGNERRRYLYPIFKLQPAQFGGVSVLVPDNAEKIVESQYGPDWRTPRTDWSWWDSPKNLDKP